MSLLALIAAQGATEPPPDPDPDPGAPLPYAIPTSYPFNVPVWCDLPTPDGTGSAIHPAVWDFGPGQTWNGYRYWMANTPYYQQDVAQENPCVWASNNGFDWVVPAGGPNPVYPYLGGGAHYSDTDIWYDEVTDELLLIWRGPGEDIQLVASSDGVTWPPLAERTMLVTAANIPNPGSLFVAPSVVKAHDGGWRMYAGHGGYGFMSAPSVYGPWSGWTMFGDGWPSGWHCSVIYDEAIGLYVLFDGHLLHTSTDGVWWGHGAEVLAIAGGAGMWEKANYYRNAIRPSGPDHYGLWYTSSPETTPNASFYTAYTRVPKSILKAPRVPPA